MHHHAVADADTAWEASLQSQASYSIGSPPPSTLDGSVGGRFASSARNTLWRKPPTEFRHSGLSGSVPPLLTTSTIYYAPQ